VIFVISWQHKDMFDVPRRVCLAALPVMIAAAALSTPGESQEKALPVFAGGQAQVVEEFRDSRQWVRQELWVEADFDSDGDGRRDRLHVDVTRQRQTATESLKVPAIYESSPYYGGTSGPRAFLWNVNHELGAVPPPRASQPPIPFRPARPVISTSHVETWLPRGFAVIHSDSPGTGLSDGCPTVGGLNESLAPKAIVDWLNSRARGFTTRDGDEPVTASWSSGKVAMIGTSYGGTLAVAAATTGVAGLEAIVPIAPNTSYYHYYRSYGLVRHPGGWLGEDIDFLFDFISSGRPERREYCAAALRDGEMAAGRDRMTGDYNAFWASRDYGHRFEQIKAATLVAHAFNDWNVMPEHSVRLYEALKATRTPAQIYFHQGGHGGAPPADLLNRWFTRYLYGVENGVEKDPRSWIVREDADRMKPTPYADYPHPSAAPVRMHLTAGGASIGGLNLTDRPRQGLETLVDDVKVSGAELAALGASEHRLLYATGPLAEAIHVSGRPEVTIRLASSKPAANLSVWLVTLPWVNAPDGTPSLITRGWADPQNHESLTRGTALEPGRHYAMTFGLQPDDQIVPAGARIGLMIFSSDRDFTLRPQPGTTLTIDVDETSVVIPVVGGAPALSRALGER
jgi:X-Pro dipeptidyl-peptidase